MINYIMLVVLHLIGDFYLQSSKMAQCKNARINSTCKLCTDCEGKTNFNLKHIAFHSLAYTIPFLALFFLVEFKTAMIAIPAILVSHGLVDILTCCLNNKYKQTLVFLLDQAIHSVILFGCWNMFFFNHIPIKYELWIKVIFLMLLIMTPASILISKLFFDVFGKEQKEESSKEKGIFDTGSVIGIFERILVVILAYYNSFSTIAIIITIKTWARSNDLKEGGFRNRYLLGTLASLVWAMLSFILFQKIK